MSYNRCGGTCNCSSLCMYCTAVFVRRTQNIEKRAGRNNQKVEGTRV